MYNEDKKIYAALAVIGAILLLVLAIVTGLVYYHDRQKEEAPQVLTTEQVKDPDIVAKEVHVSQPAAQTIVREIERSADTPPAVTYYVQAPNVEKAATETSAAIKKQSPNLPAAVTKKTDRTIVTADTDQQKVDVYKITLRKVHKIKTGMTYIDNRAYITAGYQAGRWEGLAHFNNDEFKGATVMYTIKEW